MAMTKISRTLLIVSITLAILIFGSAGSYVYWNAAPPHKTCLSCHEISNSFDMWARSSHRDLNCKTCHGTALSNGYHSLREKGRMIVNHFKNESNEDIHLSESQIFEMMDRCKSCHQNQYAKWLSGGHSMKYTDVFLNVTHNATEQINEDCLRCHGMFFEGTVYDVVDPISIDGPWQLKNTDLADKPAIPCLACHSIHEENFPTTEPFYDEPKQIHYQRLEKIPTIGLYIRREKNFFRAQVLPKSKINYNNEKIIVSDDLSQKVCVQCHAPNSFHSNGSGDDRTPRGVHEGLSCKSCHAPHSNDTKNSCANCHPKTSNCGLDVTKMNTTFADPESPNNIHFVSCLDCHPEM